MDAAVALLLTQDGITNGAIYALLALALVLVFAVTRVLHCRWPITAMYWRMAASPWKAMPRPCSRIRACYLGLGGSHSKAGKS
jgi:hypothetical protein